MNKNNFYLLLIAATMALFHSCKKDDVTPPTVTFSETAEAINAVAQTKIKIEATVVAGNNVTQSWKIDDRLVSTSAIFEHSFDSIGTYVVSYAAVNNFGEVKKQYIITIAAPVRSGGKSAFVDSLYEFSPAPGQFINKAPGNLESAKSIVGKTGMVSIGAWGGYVVYGFDHSIPNKDGADIEVKGNALPEWSEPGIIYVMADDNGNGKPDDIWYELAGSEFGNAATYRRNYEVTYYKPDSLQHNIKWRDNLGDSGFVKRNNFHKQAYYPEWLTGNSYTLKGSWLKTKVDPSKPTYVTSLPYDWGYADNQVEAKAGGKVDISNAVDANGNKVNLKAIDFIKVQTGVLGDGGWLGEASTEVISIADLHFTPHN